MESVILKQVKATRMAARMAETVQGLMLDCQNATVADEIYGQSLDSLVRYGDITENGLGFDELQSMLASDMSDGEIAKRICQGTEMPAPHIVSEEQRQECLSKNGGYRRRSAKYAEEPDAEVYKRLNRTTAIVKNLEAENTRMRQIIKEMAEGKCCICFNGGNGRCRKEDCKWYRYKSGDFS